MSTSSHSPEASVTSPSSPSLSSPDFVKDIYLWKKKKRSVLVIAVSTATWIMMEFYGFNFIPVVCWVAMFIVTSVFLWGNLARFFRREMPSLFVVNSTFLFGNLDRLIDKKMPDALSVWEVSEEFAMVSQNTARLVAEEGILWMFRVGAEDKWFVFGGIVVGLWLLSTLAGLFSFLSFSYIGVVISMTVPLIFLTYEKKIKVFRDRMESQGRRLYRTMDNKFNIKESKEKVAEEDKGRTRLMKTKEKKVE